MSNMPPEQRKRIAGMIRAVADGLENGRFDLVDAEFTLPFQADSVGWHHRKMVVEVREFWGLIGFHPDETAVGEDVTDAARNLVQQGERILTGERP